MEVWLAAGAARLLHGDRCIGWIHPGFPPLRGCLPRLAHRRRRRLLGSCCSCSRHFLLKLQTALLRAQDLDV